MGKASAIAQRLRTQPLSPAEIRARQAAIDIADDDVYPNLDGQFVRRSSPPVAVRTTVEYTEVRRYYREVREHVVGLASRIEWD